MSKQRFSERQQDVHDSMARLTEVLALPENDVVRDATIQRFEMTFEVIWKTLQLYLQWQGHTCGGARSTLKSAFQENLITTAEEADLWFQILEDRNRTSHTYDELLAKLIYRRIAHTYAATLAQMADRIQQLTWD